MSYPQNPDDEESKESVYLDAAALQQHDGDIEMANTSPSPSPTFQHNTERFRSPSTASIVTANDDNNNDNSNGNLKVNDHGLSAFQQIDQSQRRIYTQHQQHQHQHNHNHDNKTIVKGGNRYNKAPNVTNLNQTFSGAVQEVNNYNYHGNVQYVQSAAPKKAKKARLTKKYPPKAMRCRLHPQFTPINSNGYMDTYLSGKHQNDYHGGEAFIMECGYSNCRWSIRYDSSQNSKQIAKDHLMAHKFAEALNRL